MAFTDYTTASAGSPSSAAGGGKDEEGYLSLGKLKGQYLDFLSTKREEIDEQKRSRRYRHGSHYTDEQIEKLTRRKQPIVTYNRIARKIDGVVGLVERSRQDPKAFPRTPKHEQGAELATAVLRYVMDEQEWKAKTPIIAADAATEGYGGIEIVIEGGDRGDSEIALEIVAPDTFFYDPRSFRLDFSDARYMGVGKWVDVEFAKEMFPDKAGELQSAMDGEDLTTNADREQKWYASEQGRVRIVDHWYVHGGKWCFCIYTGSMKLMEGQSYLADEKGKPVCKFFMFSSAVDQDGDRYGFVRNLKSAQDEINARRAKGLHELHTRRIIGQTGAFDNIEETRREAARADGVVLSNPGFEAKFDDTYKIANIEGQLKFLEDAKAEIENFGPNPALIGQGIENKSGRAISLLQQAGLTELGPYMLAYRGWKIRVYRAIFSAIQRHWTGERWIRVTDEDELTQFIQINGVGTDPNTGQPVMVNALGSLDVDIILDEGADQVNMMADAYDTLTVLAQKGAQVPPAVLVELAPLQGSIKKRILEMLKQPGPAQEMAAAKVGETQANTALKQAQAVKTMAEARSTAPEMPEGPDPLEVQERIVRIDAERAKAGNVRAQTLKTLQEAALAPRQLETDAERRAADSFAV